MNEQDWADRFSRDVDSLLNGAGRTDSEPTLTEYRQALDLARTLAAADFSAESQVRQTLRRRLLNRTGAREGWQLREEYPMRTFFWQRHPAVTLAAVVLTVLLVVALAWSGALTATAQGIEDFVQGLVLLGQRTTLHRVGPILAVPYRQTSPPATPVVEQRSDSWTIRTAIGTFGGDVPPGRDAAVRHFRTFDEAQAAASFNLCQPGYLPAGYTLREAMLTPLDWAFLFYGGPEGDIILAQMPVGERPGSEAGHVVATTVGMLTDKPIKSVTMNGQPATWIDYALLWRADGISFVLGGLDLSLDEATRIAESLE